MKPTEETTQAFVIRIWIEPREMKGAEPIWRGVIEHVESGTRVYFSKLEQILANIIPYMEEMGVKIDKPEL